MSRWFQKEINIKPKARGFHLITAEILDQLSELKNFKVGLANIFIKHTSASLTINENADPDVRTYFESFFNDIAAENKAYYVHTCEGPDDMPAHLKSSMLGNNLNIPVYDGKFRLGTWQGIYLCEHRNHGGSRKLVITLNGE